MYNEGGAVLKRDVSGGIRKGVVIQSWRNVDGEEYVRVRWDKALYSGTSKASRIYPDTPKNRAKLEKRYEKYCLKNSQE